MDLHEAISIPKLLFVGGVVDSIAKGQSALAKGNVYVERWNLSIAEVTLPRWVLRGVTISVGDRSLTISEDGSAIVREPTNTIKGLV